MRVASDRVAGGSWVCGGYQPRPVIGPSGLACQPPAGAFQVQVAIESTKLLRLAMIDAFWLALSLLSALTLSVSAVLIALSSPVTDLPSVEAIWNAPEVVDT